MTSALTTRFIPIAIVLLFIAVICSNVDSLSSHSQQQQQSSCRRTFLGKATTVATTVAFLPGLQSLILPESASAYERRDVGDDNRSATTAAYNEQAYQTNNRLEKEGFKLDTREEEKAKLSEAMASFSYESSSSTSKKKTGSTSSKAVQPKK